MEGRWQQNYASQSEADLSLCGMLAFWLGRDAELIDRVFRTSGLMREKWDKKRSGSTYGAITVSKAISECRSVYGEKNHARPMTDLSGGKRNIKTYSLDDTGNARRLFDNYGSRLLYCYQNDKWYYWDNIRWREDISGTVDRLTDRALEIMRTEAAAYEDEPKKSSDFAKHMRYSGSSKAKAAAKRELRHLVPVVLNSFDRDRFLLNTPCGIYDLNADKIIPHSPARLITRLTGTGISEGDCAGWKAFLNTVFSGDEELIRYVQKAAGYSLTGSVSEQCVFFLCGSGKNGKSTFLDILRAVMGDYACNAQPETIMAGGKSGGAARSDIARLKGARFVTTAEPNAGMRIDEGLLKQLTGGDPVTARFQYSSEIEYFPEFKLWMAANHKPVIKGTDAGIWRRIHIIPFSVSIPDDRTDRFLSEKLRRELPFILKWAAEGYMMYKSEGLRMPPAVLNAVNEYRLEMDSIAAFINDCCSAGGSVLSSALYAEYCRWTEENGGYKMPHAKFTAEMKRKGFLKEHIRNGTVFRGISVKNN